MSDTAEEPEEAPALQKVIDDAADHLAIVILDGALDSLKRVSELVQQRGPVVCQPPGTLDLGSYWRIDITLTDAIRAISNVLTEYRNTI